MIDATRGKPNAEQVALANELINMPLDDFKAEDGTDVRNYGGADGLPEMKRIFAELLGVETSEIIVGTNSSLNMMFDTIATMILTGKWDASRAKFICPAPGYDRHFSVCEYFGIKMLTVPMTPDGPCATKVAQLMQDPDVVGIWCVPVFSNPQGYVYSNEIISHLAKAPAAHPHFKIMWDDAYTIHHFEGERPKIANILTECRENGNESRPILFTSFSKISVAGGGVVCLAAAGESQKILRERLSKQTIGPDKVNQLRHAKYFKNAAGVEAHMKKHAEILLPKFELVCRTFAEKLAGIATFHAPKGGYFVSVDIPGKAKRVREICKQNGVLITEAGATFPYGNDPADSNLRFAPTFLSMEDLQKALDIFCDAVKQA